MVSEAQAGAIEGIDSGYFLISYFHSPSLPNSPSDRFGLRVHPKTRAFTSAMKADGSCYPIHPFSCLSGYPMPIGMLHAYK
jgi:hypothetical protein